MSLNAISTPSPGLLPLKRPRSKDSSNQREKKSKRNSTCPICDEVIKEATKHRKGDDAIYCEGYCDAWVHRRCTGLSATNFAKLRDAGEEYTFFCLYCEIQAQKAEIDSLMSTITTFQTSLNDLKRKLDLVNQPQQTSTQTVRAPVVDKVSNTVYQNATNIDRKFNIVVYGVAENPQNTNRQLRMKKDMENVMEALSATDIDIEPSDIKDLYRLGKYDQKSERPRPLLVKFLRSNTAIDILSSKSKLEAPIYIKPDLTPQERQKERLLLKERRSLIDNGTERRYIKIRNDSLYLNNKLHCKVSTDGNKLEYVTVSAQPLNNTSATSMESS